ncbi:4Fe-4S dicluster domain-containing protein [Clostridium sp. AF15-17LB]|nr:4Fe-4S dicluster domain-containing protein [Clostridium sp. AF15-17LB]
MDVQDCLNMLRDIKDVAFATVDAEGKPQVRMIDVMLVEEGRLYFCTARGKNFYKELMRAPDVAVTGMNQKYQMVRLNGLACRVGDQKEKIDRIFEANPSMKDVYPGESRYILEAFRIEDGQVEFFDLGQPQVCRNSFTFGAHKRTERGYYITDKCIGCGVCRDVCPQQCIIEKTPHEIVQEHCLHCGLCYESCPVEAVAGREL